ncbi:hypothetical protein AWN90_23320 [Nocardia terpenica]|uniref:Uncharacterized protein n=1 Tax=Nocardia terpenica TaxID=455432 RepID=A0A161WP80_9NOCA|nr:hypothetical protein AWN90_23320 [Nocardia terpenica]
MNIRSVVAAGALALGVVAVGAGVAQADTYIGNYATYEACQADGESPKTGGDRWECRQQNDGSWDLYTSDSSRPSTGSFG